MYGLNRPRSRLESGVYGYSGVFVLGSGLSGYEDCVETLELCTQSILHISCQDA